MKNNKGFTIVELGVSIGLVTVVSFLLFQMIVTIKKVYTATDIKTTLLTKQAIMTNKIYDDLDSKAISTITNCDVWQNSCIKFIFADNTTSTLMVDPLKNVLSYNNYTINYDDIDDTITFGNLVYNDNNSGFFSIKIPILSSSIEGDYGINIVKQYSNYIASNFATSYATINIPLSDTASTTITNDGSSYWMRVYDASNAELNSIMSGYLKRLKTTPCSASDFIEASYELKTGNNVNRWCQNNTFYTQDIFDNGYKRISGSYGSALGKDTYIEALSATQYLKDTTLDLRVDSFVELYTFKSI